MANMTPHPNELSVVVLATLSLLAAYNCYLCVRVLRSDAYGPVQKAAQCMLLWLVPILGAILVRWFLLNGTQPIARTDTDFIPETHRMNG